MSGGFDSGGGKLGHSTLTASPAPTQPDPGKGTATASALPRTTAEAGAGSPISPSPSAAPSSVERYADMLVAVQAAKTLTDHAKPDDPQARAQILALLDPVERRLGQLNDHQGRLAQFGAGNIAGQAALDMSEAAIRSWRQLLSLGSIVRTEELVTRFRVGSEVIQFLTGEQRDAPTLREFNHVSGLVGMGAAAPVLAPPLAALAVTEAPLLAFAARIAARQVGLWAAAHPAGALAASEVLLGFGLQIGEDGWESFWGQLQDPQGRWFVVAQILMDYMHVKSSMGGGHDTSSPRRSLPVGVEPSPDLDGATQRLAKARTALQHVGDAAAAEPAPDHAGAARDPLPRDAAAGPEVGARSSVGEPMLAGAGPSSPSSGEPYPDNPFAHVPQRRSNWCGAACGEMAARRIGVEVDQSALAATSHFEPQWVADGRVVRAGGFQTAGLTTALAEVAQTPGRRWVGGQIRQALSTPQELRTHLQGYLSSTKASIILRVSGGDHWIVVDDVLPDGRVVIRDPGENASSIVTAEQLSSQKPTGDAVFSFPERQP